MKGRQLSLFDTIEERDVRDEPFSIEMIVERPDGTTYTQQVIVPPGATIEETIEKQRRVLGKSYYICDYHEV